MSDNGEGPKGWTIRYQTKRSTVYPAHRSGMKYGSCLSNALSTLVMTADQLWANPIFMPRAATYTEIGCEVTAVSATKNMKLGIYTDDGAGYPASLVVDSGNVSVGSVTYATATISAAVVEGWHWLVMVTDGTPTVRSHAGTSLSFSQIGFANGTTTSAVTSLMVAYTYAALPATFPGSAAISGASPRVLIAL